MRVDNDEKLFKLLRVEFELLEAKKKKLMKINIIDCRLNSLLKSCFINISSVIYRNYQEIVSLLIFNNNIVECREREEKFAQNGKSFILQHN